MWLACAHCCSEGATRWQPTTPPAARRQPAPGPPAQGPLAQGPPAQWLSAQTPAAQGTPRPPATWRQIAPTWPRQPPTPLPTPSPTLLARASPGPSRARFVLSPLMLPYPVRRQRATRPCRARRPWTRLTRNAAGLPIIASAGPAKKFQWPPANGAAQLPFSRLNSSAPAWPSSVMPCAFWKLRMALRVRSPNTPSMSPMA